MSQPPPVPEANEFWTRRRFMLMLAAVVLAVFPKVALGLTTFYFRDYGALGYPGSVYLQHCLFHGELPEWNSYSHCGVPFLEQMGSWYPLNWLFLFLPLPWGVNILVLLHLLLGGCGMYALTRRWGVGGFAASFAALAYLFNGVSLSCFQWGNYIASLGWLPWVVLTVTMAWHEGGRWIGMAAIVSALQVLTATPELTLMAWLFLAALWLGELLAGKIKFGPAVLRPAGVILLAAGMTMIQMLPFFDLLEHSQRDTTYDDHTRWAMPGWGWANLVVPLFHNYLSPQGNWFQHEQDFLMSYYPGLGVLALAAVGVRYGRGRTRLVVALALITCWIMALGEAGHLYPLIKKIFPWIGIARFPVKFTTLASFLVPLLAAWAIEAIQASPDARVKRALTLCGGSLTLLAGGLVWFGWHFPFPSDEVQAMTVNAIDRVLLLVALVWGFYKLAGEKIEINRIALQFGLLGILMVDLLTHSPGIVPTLPASVLAPGMWQADGRTAPAPGTGRIMVSPAAEQQMVYSYVKDPQLNIVGHRLAEWYNFNLMDLVPKVNGAFTLRPASYDLMERRIYYTTGGTIGDGFLNFVSARWISDPANPAKWLERTNYLPVMTAGQRPEFRNDAQALDAILDRDFNPRRVVYLPESMRAAVTISNQTTCTVTNVRFGEDLVEAEVQADNASMLVIGQTYYHHWRAEVDGQPMELFRANVAFQALEVPAGTHQVRLVYRDPNLVIGAGISGVSVVVCLVVIGRRKHC